MEQVKWEYPTLARESDESLVPWPIKQFLQWGASHELHTDEDFGSNQWLEWAVTNRTEGLPLSSRRIQLAKFCSTIKVSSFPPSLLGQSCQALAILSTFMCWTWAGTTSQGQFLMSCQTWQASKRWSQWEHSIITNKAEFPLQVCRVVQQCLDCYQTLQSEDEHQDMYTSKQITHIMVWNALHFARP